MSTSSVAATPSYPDVQLLIDGIWQPADSGRQSPIHNPATSEVIGQFAHAGISDLDRAAEAAARGFDAWRQVSAFDRYKLMRKAGDVLRGRVDTIAPMMTMEQGKPIEQSRAEVLSAADIVDWFAEEGRRTYGRIIPSRSHRVRQMVTKEPVGPVLALTPWNFPISQIVRKLSAALAAGCSIIVKAPEETPASPAELLRAFVDAGLPAGAVGFVLGNPAEISQHLIAHPVIKKVSFTGSISVGKQLAALAGTHMKRATMELGGHAPVIVLGDADIARAAAITSAYKFRNAGQVCISPTRFFIEDPVYEDFVTRFAEGARQIKVGNGLEPGITMGPLANSRRVEAMEALVADAIQCGARLVAGGKRIGNTGNFFEPTVLADVPQHARAMNEEPFGPLALLAPVRDLTQAIKQANRLSIGLAGYGFTTSAASAAAIGDDLATGMVAINHIALALPEVPFNGINESGYGSEGGIEAMESYLNTKFVTHLQNA